MVTISDLKVGRLPGPPNLILSLLKTVFSDSEHKSQGDYRISIRGRFLLSLKWRGSLGKGLRTASGAIPAERTASQSYEHKPLNPANNWLRLAADLPPSCPARALPDCWMDGHLSRAYAENPVEPAQTFRPWEPWDNRGLLCQAVKYVVICYTAIGGEHSSPRGMSTAALYLPLNSISSWLGETKQGIARPEINSSDGYYCRCPCSLTHSTNGSVPPCLCCPPQSRTLSTLPFCPLSARACFQ